MKILNMCIMHKRNEDALRKRVAGVKTNGRFKQVNRRNELQWRLAPYKSQSAFKFTAL